MSKSGFCIMPWISLSLRTNGEIHPCCQSMPEGKQSFFGSSNTEEVQESSMMKTIRESMMKGVLPTHCSQCLFDEKSGGSSMRTIKNNEYRHLIESTTFAPAPLPIREMDVRLSNLCKLSCLTCEPFFSTGWYKHAKGGPSTCPTGPLRSMDDLELLKSEIQTSRASLAKLTLTGGEPFIDPLHIPLLDYLIENKMTEIELEYNTSLALDQSLLQKNINRLKQFPYLKIAVSLDALEEKAEEIRRGLDWKQFNSNLDLLKEQLGHDKVFFQLTLSVLNAGGIADVLFWIHLNHPKNIQATTINIVHSPIQFDSIHALEEQKEQWINQNLMVMKKDFFSSASEDDFQHAMVLLAKAHGYLLSNKKAKSE